MLRSLKVYSNKMTRLPSDCSELDKAKNTTMKDRQGSDTFQ
jgi:hypothetical protein